MDYTRSRTSPSPALAATNTGYGATSFKSSAFTKEDLSSSLRASPLTAPLHNNYTNLSSIRMDSTGTVGEEAAMEAVRQTFTQTKTEAKRLRDQLDLTNKTLKTITSNHEQEENRLLTENCRLRLSEAKLLNENQSLLQQKDELEKLLTTQKERANIGRAELENRNAEIGARSERERKELEAQYQARIDVLRDEKNNAVSSLLGKMEDMERERSASERILRDRIEALEREKRETLDASARQMGDLKSSQTEMSSRLHFEREQFNRNMDVVKQELSQAKSINESRLNEIETLREEKRLLAGSSDEASRLGLELSTIKLENEKQRETINGLKEIVSQQKEIESDLRKALEKRRIEFEAVEEQRRQADENLRRAREDLEGEREVAREYARRAEVSERFYRTEAQYEMDLARAIERYRVRAAVLEDDLWNEIQLRKKLENLVHALRNRKIPLWKAGDELQKRLSDHRSRTKEIRTRKELEDMVFEKEATLEENIRLRHELDRTQLELERQQVRLSPYAPVRVPVPRALSPYRSPVRHGLI